MGCCQCCVKEKGWTSRHEVLREYLRGENILLTVWGEFCPMKSAEAQKMDYDEFCALIFIALEIFEKLKRGCSRQISRGIDTDETLEENIDKFRVKSRSIRKVPSARRGTMDTLDLLTPQELNERGDVDSLLVTLKEIAPKLAAQFDEDGDEMFNFTEFKAVAMYLRSEYKMLTAGYKAPRVGTMSTTAGLLISEDS